MRSTPFAAARYEFTTGVAAGETAAIRDGDGNLLLTYRSFASIVGIVAALMAGIVLITGLAAVGFLLAEGRPFAAIVAVMLSLAFSGVIALLVPPIRVAIHEGDRDALTIAQVSRFSFPSATYAIADAEGRALAYVTRNVFSRAARNRWTVERHGLAIEESLGRALLRKVAGKFDRKLDANVLIELEHQHCATVVRRPDERGNVDYLDVRPESSADRRVLVGLATLILGSEP